MKRLLQLATLLAVTTLPLKADTVAYWDFNSVEPDSNGATGTLTPKIGTGIAQVVNAAYTFANSSNDDPWVFDQSALRMAGFPSTSVSNKTAGVEFYFDTTGYEGITARWQHNNNGSASRFWRVQYTANGGTTWNDHRMLENGVTTWIYFDVDFKGVRAADNNPNFGFRVVSEFQGTAIGNGIRGYVPNTSASYSANGTCWLDILTVEGTPLDGSNTAPTITPISTQNTIVGVPTAPLSFTIGDANESSDNLTISWSTWTPNLIQDVQFSGSGANRTVVVTPGSTQGSGTVTVRVTDSGGKYSEIQFVVNARSVPSANTIAFWDFNSEEQDGNDATGTFLPRVGTGNAQVLVAAHVFQNSNNADTWTFDNSAVRMVTFPAASTGNKTAGIEFRFSTVGHEGVSVSYQHNNSQAGSRYWRVQYTPDGLAWIDHTVIENATAGWITYNIDFAGIRAADNNPNFGFRLVAEFGSTATGTGMDNYAASQTASYASGGTFWVDMVVVTAVPVSGSNTAPAISSFAAASVKANNVITIPFTVDDLETSTANLVVSTIVQTPALIQDVQLGGSGANRSITVTAADGVGTATIFVRVTDADGKYSETPLVLSVNPENTAPVISSISHQTIFVNTSAQVEAFVSDEETSAENLIVTVDSSNPRLISADNIVVSGSGSERTITLSPFAEEAGAAWITITVSDGALSTTAGFMLKVVRSETIVLWNFNSNPPDGTPSTGTEDPAFGAGFLTPVGTVTNIATSLSAQSFDPETADNSKWRLGAFPAQGEGNKTSGAQFMFSTVGYQNIAMSWDHYNSATGSKYWRVQYTLDGVEFSDFIAYTNPVVTTFRPTGVSFASIPGADNNPNFGVRLVSEFESTATGIENDAYVAVNAESNYGSGGTLWIDMVTFTGDLLGGSGVSLTVVRNGNLLEISWPASASGDLQSTGDLSTVSWQNVPETAETIDGFKKVTVSASAGMRFFRLAQ
ncbi:MAG: hypothetical protein H0X66_03275 [Verrucomicrobia bacterium]|nr:hypothetical protein [Verrucomicrobiota bacterium]